MADLSDPIVLWCGRFSTADGYGTVSRNHLRGLELAGVRHAALDLATLRLVGAHADPGIVTSGRDPIRIRTKDEADRVVVVFHERPDQYPRIRVDGRARLIGHSVFETGGLPPGWTEAMVSVDEIWAATGYNRQSFAAAGVPGFMIDCLPHSLDTALYRPEVGTVALGEPDEIVFLTVCSGLQRRDLGLVFRAFLRTFDAGSAVRLVVKLRGDDQTRRAVEALLATSVATVGGDAAHVAAKVDLRAVDLGPEDMARLYRSCDVYVSAERANGWDLPTMESMAAGKLTIGFHTGGSTEYGNDDVAIRLPVSDALAPIEQSEPHEFYTAQWWPAVDERLMDDALLRAMDPSVRSELGEAAAVHIREHYDVGVVGHRLADMVRPYGPSDFRGNDPAEIVVGRASVWRDVGGSTRPADPGPARGVTGASVATRAVQMTRSAEGRRRLRRAVETRVHRLVRRARQAAARLGRSRWSEGGVDAAVEAIRSADHDPTRIWSEEDLEDRRKAFSLHKVIPVGLQDQHRLESLRNAYANERCFVMGNGPSLNRTDLSKLAGEYTFGVNKIYLLYDRIDWRPTFYTLLDWRVGPEIAPEAERLADSVKFLPNRFRGLFPVDESTYWYTTRPILDHIDDQFRPDIVHGIPSKGTILVTAIQIAFFLGFREINLLGVDASYTIPETVRQSGPDKFGTGVKLNLESTADDDPNHFDPTYFGKGARWHDPNVDEMVRQFRQMRKGVEFHGGRIRNATAGGRLEVFDRVDFDSLFG